MSKYVPVENSSVFVRDKETNAIINTDTSGLEKARARKLARQKEHNEIKELKTEVSEMRELLSNLYKYIEYK